MQHGYAPGPPPPSRGLKMQRCPKWGQTGKCKKGHRCPMAHGDHELAPKDVRQRARKMQEEGQRKRQAFEEAVYGEAPVRQRELEADEPLYTDYSALQGEATAAEQPPPQAHDGSEYTHRMDGTPLDFSSKAARQEVQRQRMQEQRYDEQQSAWGLPAATSALAAPPPPPPDGPTCAGGHEHGHAAGLGAAAAAGGGGDEGGGCSAPPRSRGRGRAMVKPAWLAEQERAERGRAAARAP